MIDESASSEDDSCTGFIQLDENQYKAKFEIEEIEKKFRDLGISGFNSSSSSTSSSSEEVDFETFEDLNEISQQEFQQGLAWRNDM